MYLPRSLISHLYLSLLQTHTASSPPVLLLVSLDPDALCACRILSSLLKRDYIQHEIKPVSGYADLTRAGELVRKMRTTDGGSGGVVVCLGVGGLVDLEALLGLEVDEDGNGGMGGVDVWVFDARRPWNLSNVFGIQSRDSVEGAAKLLGVEQGKISNRFKGGGGGIIVFDDGDIEEELAAEKEAYCLLADMPELGEDEAESEDGSDSEGDDEEYDSDSGSGSKRKRRSTPQFDEDEETSDPDEGTPSKRRRSNSSSPIPSSPGQRPARRGLLILSQQNGAPAAASSSLPTHSPTKQPSAKALRRELFQLRRKHDKVLQNYNMLGTSYSEPISSLMWNLASDLGRDDNDLLWLSIVGISSLEISGRTSSGIGLSPVSTSGASSGWNKERGSQIKAIFRDEVRRLNHPDEKDLVREALGDGAIIQTNAKSPNDTSIRLSPEPRLLLVRHWSLYDSMLHSPYLSTKLHVWDHNGRKKLHKLLAKMGISLTQSKQNYTHMDMDVKRSLREKLLKFAPVYGLEGLVPAEARYNTKEGWGFVRSWGYKACLSAIDVVTILGAILEVGKIDAKEQDVDHARAIAHVNHSGANTPRNATDSTIPGAAPSEPMFDDEAREDTIRSRFFAAYDALGDINKLKSQLHTAKYLHRAILRTGTSLIEKKQIKRLKSFHIAVVKEGPDVRLFTHPGALIKLALWIAEAISEMEGVRGRKGGELVMAGLDEERGVYVVVGLGGGSIVAAHKEKEAKKAEKRKEKLAKKEKRKADKAKKKAFRREQLEALGESDVEDEDDSESESEEESDSEDESEQATERGKGLNRFGNAFQEVIAETGVRVKVDNFEHCVVEVRKEDLPSFFESLCMKTVVG